MKQFMIAFMFGTLASLFSITATAEETVNINTADAATLAKVLSGVGEVKAKAIVDYRKDNGGNNAFQSVDDITKVNGIGPKTLENNRSKMRVSDKPAQKTPKEETSTKKEDASTSKKTSETETKTGQ